MSAPRGYPGKASFYPGDRSRASDVAERRRRKWLTEGVLEIDPADIEDDEMRKTLMKFGNEEFGKRGGTEQ